MMNKISKNIILVFQAVVITAVISVLNFNAWQYLNHESLVGNANGLINGYAYSAYQKNQKPGGDVIPSTQDLFKDLKLMSEKTKNIRTYSALENAQIPELAQSLDLKVTQGIWLDRDKEKNEREIQAGINLANENSNIERIMVGNEVLLREELTEDEVISIIKRVRKEVKNKKIIISTAEPWHIWHKYPKLAKEVFQITVHILPYNEGIHINGALPYAMMRYEELAQMYPKKRILIGETGWPSNGDNLKEAQPSIANEARYIREFISIAQEKKLDYFLMEAIDQPWKAAQEGWAGSYWGMYNADRVAKFELQGNVNNRMFWRQNAELSTLIGILPIFIFCLLLGRIKLFGRIWIGALLQLCISLVVIAIGLPQDYYMSNFDLVILTGLVIGMLTTSAVLMIQGFEILEVLYNRYWARSFHPQEHLNKEDEPFVCIQLACCNEPPEMVLDSVRSLEKLEYSNFFVMVVDNNTKDEALWKPVEEYMSKLDPEKFKFYHLPSITGFKAGALNVALQETPKHMKIIAVIDADYVVSSDWLSKLVPHFNTEKTAVVQSPQAHRLWEHSLFRRWVNWEFDGFFRIGMHHRNERNALIQHGTMTMVRKEYLEKVGGWSQWCICEDTELGLKLLEEGLELQYVDEVYGHGLTPANFSGLKSQRLRWAFGAMQILKGHWGKLIGKSKLTFSQRYHFLTGWVPWISELLQFVFAFSTIVWTIAMCLQPSLFTIPVVTLLTPILVLLLCKSFLGLIAYKIRVKCSWFDVLGTSIMSVGLSHAIARGVFAGLVKKTGTFVITPKGWKANKGFAAITGAVREELGMLVAILLAIFAYLHTRELTTPVLSWIGIMLMQSVPYWCSLICQAVSLKQKPE